MISKSQGFAYSLYSSADYFFGNMIPLGITLFIIGTDTITFAVITIMSIYNTVIEEHSNYNTSRHHLDHHKYFNCNGAIWLDKFFNTLRITDNIKLKVS